MILWMFLSKQCFPLPSVSLPEWKKSSQYCDHNLYLVMCNKTHLTVVDNCFTISFRNIFWWQNILYFLLYFCCRHTTGQWICGNWATSKKRHFTSSQKQEPSYYHTFEYNFIDVVTVLFNNANTYFDYTASPNMNQCVWSTGGMTVTGKNQNIRVTPVPVPLWLSEILRWLTCDWTRILRWEDGN